MPSSDLVILSERETVKMSTTNIEGPPPTKIMKVEATNDGKSP